MAANWEEEKKKVLQNELGVAQDDLNGGSVLGRSTLGQSQRRVSHTLSIRSRQFAAINGIGMAAC
jgi:hypothetical protein